MAQCDGCGQNEKTVYAQPIPGERFACLLCEACFAAYRIVKAGEDTRAEAFAAPAGSERPGEVV